MPELIAPTIELYASWLDARDEWGRGTHQDGSGLRPADDVDTAAGFAAWVDRLHSQGDESLPTDEGWVHTTHRWIVEQDAYLGAISLRHRLNDFLRRAGGHIGYGVRPSARGRIAQATEVTLRLTPHYRLPETTRLADRACREVSRHG